MLTHLPNFPPNKFTPRIEKMSQKIMQTEMWGLSVIINQKFYSLKFHKTIP